MRNYPELDSLDQYYFEDSFVLAVIVCESFVEFTVLAVLTTNHPDYLSPKPNEQHCYEYYRLAFPNLRSSMWERKSFAVVRDGNSDVDFGAIDLFFEESGNYILEGDWGSIRIQSDPPQMIRIQY